MTEKGGKGNEEKIHHGSGSRDNEFKGYTF